MRRIYSVLSICLLITVNSNGRTQETLKTPADRPVDVQHIKLDIEVFLKEKRIAGSATLDLIALRRLDSLSLDAVGHEVSSIRETKANLPVKFENTGEKLLLDFGRPVERGEMLQLTIAYQVRQPKGGLYFFGPSAGEPDVPLTCWTQGEAILNRHWFPCLDNPNERQTSEVIATVDVGNEVISNGRLLSREKLAGGAKERFHWKQSESHVAYLISLAVGKFAVGRDVWREIPLLYFAPPDREADIVGTFGRTKEMIELFSTKFGVDYPWEKYSQVVVEQFIAGGQENTSATSLYSGTMHDKRALLDDSPEGLTSHELGHQWWGDLLTCKDWAHLWLNEGFATYCEVIWEEHRSGKDERDLLLFGKSQSARSGSCLTRPIVDRFYNHPDDMFDSRAYPKGGWVLHMLRSQLGDEDFFAGLKRYATDNRYQTVETTDLRRAFERQTGRALDRFFIQWTDRPGHPVLDVTTSYEAEQKAIKVVISQKQKGDVFWFPLRIEFRRALGQNNPQPAVFEREIRERETTAYIPAPSRPDLVRVDPNLTVLAEINEFKSRDLWVKQTLEAPGVAERLRAIAHFAESKAPEDIELMGRSLNGDAFHAVRSAAAVALGKMGGDAARDLLLAGLAQPNLKVRRSVSDALGNFAADDKVAAALRQKFLAGDPSYFVEASLLGALAKVVESTPADVVAEALKRPSHQDVIRKAALSVLGRSKDAQALPQLLEWLARGKPSECRIAAIRALATQLAHSDLKDEDKKKAASVVIGYINGEGPRVRRAAVETLRDLGKLAEPAEFVLQSLAEQDPDGRVREYSKAAVEKIHTQTPPAVELTKLHAELEKLRKTNKTLEDRLLRLERR